MFVVSRFDCSRLRFGRGDHWITGGALAISTLAAGNIAVGLWAVSMVWLPALVLAEVLHPRLRYDVRRWSTVFPVGVYAACSIVVGSLAHAGAITSFGLVWVWVAVVLWAAVFAAMFASKSVRTRTN